MTCKKPGIGHFADRCQNNLLIDRFKHNALEINPVDHWASTTTNSSFRYILYGGYGNVIAILFWASQTVYILKKAPEHGSLRVEGVPELVGLDCHQPSHVNFLKHCSRMLLYCMLPMEVLSLCLSQNLQTALLSRAPSPFWPFSFSPNLLSLTKQNRNDRKQAPCNFFKASLYFYTHLSNTTCHSSVT